MKYYKFYTMTDSCKLNENYDTFCEENQNKGGVALFTEYEILCIGKYYVMCHNKVKVP